MIVIVGVDFFYNFDKGCNFLVLFLNLMSFLMFQVFYFYLEEHIECISDVVPPMIVEFEEYFPHQEHYYLVFCHLVELIEVTVEDCQQTTHCLIVFSFKNDTDYFEEIVVVESRGELSCFLL